MFNVVEQNRDEFHSFQQGAACRMALTNRSPVSLSRNLEEHAISHFSINTQVIIQNRALSSARYLGLSADNHLDGQNGCQ